MDNKKKYVSLILLVFAVVIVTISASFAFFSYSREGVVNVLQMGNIEFAMLDGDNVLITNAFPQSDDEGNLNEAYSFTVKNTSSEGFDIYYDLLFLDNNKEDNVNYFKNSQIKYSLVKNGVYVAKTSSTEGVKIGNITGFNAGNYQGEGTVLKKQLIQAGETDSYNLRIWISDDVDYSTEETNGLVNGAFNDYKYSLKVKIATTSGQEEYVAGLYNSEDEMVYNWQELLDMNYIAVNNGSLSVAGPGRGNLVSKLVVDNSVTAIAPGGFAGVSELKNIVFPETITDIGQSAFAGSGLESVDLSNTKVTIINTGVFTGTQNLNTAILSETVKEISTSAFAGSGLENITLPESLEIIGSSAFAETKIKELIIPKNVTSVASNAIYQCYDLKSYIHHANIPIDSYIFQAPNIENFEIYDGSFGVTISSLNKIKTATIGGTLTKVPSSIFSNNTNLTTVTLGDNVDEIGSNAFYQASSLSTIDLKNIKKVGQSAFQSTRALSTVNLNSIEYIDNNAFLDSAISNLTLSNKLTYIGNWAFGHTELTEFTIPESVTSLGLQILYSSPKVEKLTNYANIMIANNNIEMSNSTIKKLYSYNGGFEHTALSELSKLEYLYIGENVHQIDSFSFQGATFNEVEFDRNNKISIIGGATFEDCANLTKVTLSDNVEEIKYEAFYGCSKLTEINLPSTLLSIEKLAFYNCALLDLTVPNSVTSIGSRAFQNVSHITYNGEATFNESNDINWGATSIN